jgi:hypothetical protein
MKRLIIPAPDADEYAPHHAAYVALMRERDVAGVMRRQMPVLRSVCAGMSEREALTRYAAGKWSIKQVIGHLADTERVLAYRMLRIVRADPTPLPGFDEASYVEMAQFESRPLASLLRELESVRAATLRLLETIAPDAWRRCGIVHDQPVSARALASIIGGHVEHHFDLLRERYDLPVPHVEAPTV